MQTHTPQQVQRVNSNQTREQPSIGLFANSVPSQATPHQYNSSQSLRLHLSPSQQRNQSLTPPTHDYNPTCSSKQGFQNVPQIDSSDRNTQNQQPQASGQQFSVIPEMAKNALRSIFQNFNLPEDQNTTQTTQQTDRMTSQNLTQNSNDSPMYTTFSPEWSEESTEMSTDHQTTHSQSAQEKIKKISQWRV